MGGLLSSCSASFVQFVHVLTTATTIITIIIIIIIIHQCHHRYHSCTDFSPLRRRRYRERAKRSTAIRQIQTASHAELRRASILIGIDRNECPIDYNLKQQCHSVGGGHVAPYPPPLVRRRTTAT